MRLQLALNVDDLAASVDFYARLFGVAPHKVREGYANFEIAEPPLKLVLLEAPGAKERMNHVGVEVEDANALARAGARLMDEGLIAKTEEGVVCCHAEQDKVWSQAPDGLAWEWYRITDDAPAAPAPRCC